MVVGVGNFISHQTLRSQGAPRRLRARVLARDQGRCQIGGPDCRGVAVEVDHVVPVSEGGLDELDNLQSVCSACHSVKTQAEAQRARRKFSRRRAPAPRPGSLP